MKKLIIRLRSPGSGLGTSAGFLLAAWLLAGCAAPIGADRVTTRLAYEQVDANALRTGKPSADTISLLHRYGLDVVAARHPDEAVRQLHEKAVATGHRDLLFALAELSYAAGDNIRRSVKAWDPRDARDYYLGSAVYAWLFLFGKSDATPPSPFDRRFRDACDLYNYGLGLALVERRDTNGVVQLKNARRRLPVGEIELRLDTTGFSQPVEDFQQILLADQFRVRGLSVRNREPGLGAPLICVGPFHEDFGLRRSSPATAFLRGPDSLAELTAGTNMYAVELYLAYDRSTVAVGGSQVPLEIDLTTYRAYVLSQSKIWKLGWMQFLAPAERFPSQLVMNQPFDSARIPVVLVHGTFSTAVVWAEMGNTLLADPEIRRRYQFWSFIYGSGNPLPYSIADLRKALTEQVEALDPQGTNAALRQMVVIGHSQGGLLAKSTAVDNGDRLWRILSTNRFEDVKLSDSERAEIRRLLFYKPLPFVKRVVFIATPHRGSYLSGSLARRWGQHVVSLTSELVSSRKRVLSYSQDSEISGFLKGKMPTSLDGMSPKNPGLLAMRDVPVAPEIKAHSIIPVLGEGDLSRAKDGSVTYESAHVDEVESELIVKSKHSCLQNPATIEEVRRILHLHLDQLHDDTKHAP